jgi:DNA-damage-inducible protein J
MRNRNSLVRARVNDNLKHDVEGILSGLGLTMSDAINALFNQIRLHKGLPFELKIPNEITQSTLERSANAQDIERFDSVDELFDDLEDK